MCQKVSPGCAHCYAEGITRRFWPKDARLPIKGSGLGATASVPFPGYTALGLASGEFVLDEEKMLQVLRHKKPTRIFWGDMTDLFQESVPDVFLDRIFAVCALTPHITHMFLTKRAERMRRYFSEPTREAAVAFACVRNGQPLAPGYFSMKGGADLWEVFGGLRKLRFVDERVNGGVPASTAEWNAADFDAWPLPNVWLGVSVESDEYRWRIEHLRKTPAAVRYLSCEPLVGPLSLRWLCGFSTTHPKHLHPETEASGRICTDEYDGLRELDWVICGGESGSGKDIRPMHPDWARSLRDQCAEAGAAFFFKQWGEWAPGECVDATHGVVQTADWFGGVWDFDSENLANDEGHIDDEPTLYRVGKKAAGNHLDGQVWQQFPEVSR
jgi:protein gp37